MMNARVLRGSKQEIAEIVTQIRGDVREAIVFVEEPASGDASPAEDVFAEMEPFVVNAGDADFSREAIYTRMEGE
jgi:hypothetical protein